MEISVIGSSQVVPGRVDFGHWETGLCNFAVDFTSRRPRFCFRDTIICPRSRFGLTLRASSGPPTPAIVSDNVSTCGKSKPTGGLKLYVGLPLDAVSDCNTINHARAIAAGLKALKLLGVDGVELPVWWGVAEKAAMGEYDWTGYLDLADIVRKVGLDLHVSLCFHASKEPRIPLPEWVSKVGKSQPDIFFSDRSGRRYEDCLSLAVDELPVLDGKTPIQVYKQFCESFKSSFSHLIGSTITGISIGLGPDGELRYPSYHRSAIGNGAGEFQCYDANMLGNLKQHAESNGNPLWGLGGPHDGPGYHQLPLSSAFFKEEGGSWETPYGDFFLSWYSSQLLSHCDRLLSVASLTFGDTGVKVSGKLPLMHSWYRTRSHPAELTAGFYNTASRDGYEAVAEVFARNSCRMIVGGMDLSDKHQPQVLLSSPESLLGQITSSCKGRGVEISGQNALGASEGLEQIKKNLMGEDAAVDLFTYQRMGAYFFSPEHFPAFTEFVRSLNQPRLHSDDLPAEGTSRSAAASKDLQMQTV